MMYVVVHVPSFLKFYMLGVLKTRLKNFRLPSEI